MNRDSLEARGKTADEAVAVGLARLGLAREQVEVEVIDPGSRGFLGLGAREAAVKLTPKLSPPQAVRLTVEEILAAGGFATRVATEWDEATGIVTVSVAGEDLGLLIGRRGRTLDALQSLLNVACCRPPAGPRQVLLDVGGYRQRRAETVTRMALRGAESVRRTGRSVSLEPMPASERRLVHLALQDCGDLATRSEGRDPERRVIIERKGTSEAS